MSNKPTPLTDAALINAPVFQDKTHADCWSIDKDDWDRFLIYVRSLERRLAEARSLLLEMVDDELEDETPSGSWLGRVQTFLREAAPEDKP